MRIKRTKKMKILCGIQPSGRLHIGNYLGVIKKGIELQKDNEVLFLVANYHALTSQTEKEVFDNSESLSKELFKLGCLNIERQYPDVLLTAYKLSCITPLGLIHRMTQYKEKKDTLNNAGLLYYPILMAADIMDSDCDAVLVGSDQIEHIEFANSIFKKCGHKQVKAIHSYCPRIMDLKDPTKKMSKSNPSGCLFLDDSSNIFKANTNELGLKNIINIGKEFGVSYSKGNNKKLKEDIYNKITKICQK
jgi:tryptophanyl-tRNA synthetase